MTNDIVMFWNAKAAAVLDIHTNPGHDTRRFAIVQIAIHDALNSIKPRYARYAYQAEITRDVSPEAAITGAAAHALHWAVDDINEYIQKLPLPSQAPFSGFIASNWAEKIASWYNEKMESKNIPDGLAKVNGMMLGVKSAAAVIDARANDGSNKVELFSDRPDGIGPPYFRADYYDKPPAPKNKLMVGFGEVTPFVIKTADQFRQDLNYSQSELTIHYDEVEEKGTAEYVNALPQEEKDKVDFWSKLEQHIVWNNFAVELIKTKRMDAWETARLFALIHTAMADGVISMFKDVYEFYHWRPVTAINYKYNGHPLSNPKWTPYKGTPRVPEYPSGFGIAGGAAGQILETIFPDKIKVDLIHLRADIASTTNRDQRSKISYDSISQAVNDNTETKIFCGWNFRKTVLASIVQGRLIGQYVLDNKFKGNGFLEWFRHPRFRFPKNWTKKIYKTAGFMKREHS